MRSDILKSNEFRRRAVLLGGAKLAALSILGGRLYQLQLLESDKFRTLSEGNRVRIHPIIPARGKILDRNGIILANGIQKYQATIDSLYLPKNKTEVESIIKNIGRLLELSDEEQKELLTKIADKKRGSNKIIKDFITWPEVARLEENLLDLPGVSISTAELRRYPKGQIMPHILGYVGEPSEKDIDEDNPLHKMPEFKIGKTGVEQKFNEELTGKPGFKQIEVNAHGKVIRELKSKDGTKGDKLTLTIDSNLQDYAIKTLSNKGGLQTEGGSAVIMDIHNGDVLAMASVPNYDPNKFVKGISKDDYKELLDNPDLPLLNKTIKSQYPPGSTFKTITALAALEAGVISEHTRFYCPGYHKIGGRKFHCWFRDGHGELDLRHAIAKSCNVYFYKTSLKVGAKRMHDMAIKLGLGQYSGIEIPGEKNGFIPSPAWKKASRGESWYKGETLNMSIGQGFSLSTPLQLAVQCARIANEGFNVNPRIIRNDKEIKFDRINGISEKNIRIVKRGMNMVVNDPFGIVHYASVKDPDYAFAGKTGTSQVSNKTFKYIPKARRERHHALFIGYAPAQNPRYAVSVIIEHGGYGSVAAAPVGRDILVKALKIANGEDISNFVGPPIP